MDQEHYQRILRFSINLYVFIHKIVFAFLAKVAASLFTAFISVASTASNKPAARSPRNLSDFCVLELSYQLVIIYE